MARPVANAPGSDGRPYFVMELVKGVPITHFCDERRLTPRERLELFVSVCHAIQHAHQKGVIHRDVKPSNVLVAPYDDRPVVKVIDFGVAKAAGQQLTDHSLLTEFGAIVGTLEYMSPEQADFDRLDVDTRSDVYSLGVLLYELVAGSPPFRRQDLRQVGLLEGLRRVREQEPPRPSDRLSEAEDLPALAASRDMAPARLTAAVRGELDWVVMKALEKDRDRRYESASALAADVGRYLRGEPVQAHPPSGAYRFRKFARRNAAALLGATVVAAALVAGSAVATWQAVVATTAKRGALEAAGAEKAARETAQAREAETRAVLDFVENKVFAAARPEGQEGGLGRAVTLRQTVEAALPYVANSFTDQPVIEARLRMTLGRSFSHLGEAKTASEQFHRARTLYSQHLGPVHPDTLWSVHNLANSYHALGRREEALRLHQETLELRETKLGPDHPDTLWSMQTLAANYHDLGRHGDALALREEALARRKAKLGPDHYVTFWNMASLATSYATLGRHADALTLREETLARRKAKLGADHPNTLQSMHDLALSHGEIGRHEEAAKLNEETLARRKAQLGSDNLDTLWTMHALAISYHNLGRHTNALELRSEVLARRKAKLGPDHPDTLWSMYNLANSYHALGRREEALELRAEALARQKARLGADHPDTLQGMWDVASCLVGLDRGEAAVPLIDECVRRAPGRVVNASLIPDMMTLRMRHFEKAGDAAGSRATAEMWEKLGRADAGSLYTSACLRAVTAAIARRAGKSDVADAEADRAMAWLRKAVAAGYRDAERLSKDRTLDALRAREDFKRLAAEAAGKPKD